MNFTESVMALYGIRANRIQVVHTTSEVYHNDYYNDYEKKREESKRKIHQEIQRIGINSKSPV